MEKPCLKKNAPVPCSSCSFFVTTWYTNFEVDSMTSYGLSGKEFHAVLCCHNKKIQGDTIFDVSILYFIAALIFL